jgi:hypothetical protein
VLGTVTVPSAASVYNEYALKRHMDTSVHLQNFFLYFYGAAFNLAGAAALCAARRQGLTALFAGQSRVTAVLIVNNAAQARVLRGWMVGWVGGRSGAGDAGWGRRPAIGRSEVGLGDLPGACLLAARTHNLTLADVHASDGAIRCNTPHPPTPTPTPIATPNPNDHPQTQPPTHRQGILSSFFYKFADTILKKYSSTMATIFTALMSWAAFSHPLTINFLVGVSIVFVSMHQFFTFGPAKGAPPPPGGAGVKAGSDGGAAAGGDAAGAPGAANGGGARPPVMLHSPSMDHFRLATAPPSGNGIVLAALEEGGGAAFGGGPRAPLLPR